VNVQRMPKGQLRLYDRAARLAVVSRAVEEAVGRERPAALPRVRVIPNPIDIQTFVPPAGGRMRVGSGTIVFTGRVHPGKGHPRAGGGVASACGAASRLGLRIVGPQTIATGGGGDDYLRELRRLAAGLPLEVAEPVYGRAALASVLQRADYYCYPSLADQGENDGCGPLGGDGNGAGARRF
jgi:glycosyltransferase involved in cell wall biosynthesis